MLKKSLVVETIKMKSIFYLGKHMQSSFNRSDTEANTRYRGQERKAFRASCIVPKLR